MIQETWLPIVGYDGLYEVSNTGRIASLKYQRKIRKLGKHLGGYLQVNLSKNGIVERKLVHRLVTRSFLGEAEDGQQVNHKNGVKTDNMIENLEYCTPSDNKKHSFRIGLESHVGEKHNRAKLTNNKVMQIHDLLKIGMKHVDIAKKLGVHRTTVSQIRAGTRWSHVTCDEKAG